MSVNRGLYGFRTGLPGNLTANQCRTVIKLVQEEGMSKSAVKKRFDVSIRVIDDVLAMHQNGRVFEDRCRDARCDA